MFHKLIFLLNGNIWSKMAKKGDDLQHGLSGTSRCCLCCDNSKCIQCTCVKAGRNCLNCLSSKRSRCSNKLQCASLFICDNTLLLTRGSSDNVSPSSVEDGQFFRAFGTSLLYSEGVPYSSFWG